MSLPRRVVATGLAAFVAVAVAVACHDGPWKPAPDDGGDRLVVCDGSVACDGQCVDTMNAHESCGSCGRACSDAQSCKQGVCKGCESVDEDGDGEDSCTDCNDRDPNVGHASFDVAGNKVDDDCNGSIDDVISCERSPDPTSSAPADYAHAMELCEPFLESATLTSPDPSARQVAKDWGIFLPRAGARFAAFSTGIAAAVGHTAPKFIPGETPQLGTDFKKTGAPYPGTPGAQSCPGYLADPTTVVDLTTLTLQLVVPNNAHSFSLDLDFLTADAPEWPCNAFDDQALVLLKSSTFDGNLLVDGSGHRMSINHALVVLDTPGALAGTGFDELDTNSNPKGAATGWVTLRAPVKPKETITLTIALFDSKDGLYDSQLLLDAFRWSVDTVPCVSTHAGDAGTCPGPVDGGGD